MKNNQKHILVAALAAVTVFACALGLGGSVTKADSVLQKVGLYGQDFETLTESATVDEIYGTTGIAGAHRSIVAPKNIYLESVYSFYDNGCENGALYLDTSRGIASTDVAKTYAFTVKIMPFGSFKSAVISLMGADLAKYNSVITINADGTSQADNYGTEKYVALTSAAVDADGWWTLNFTAGGTGGYIAFVLHENASDYAAANEQKNTGIRLAQCKVVEGENTVYEMILAPGVSGDAVFQTTSFAGVAAKTVGGESITGNTLKAVYDFWPTADGSWQKEGLYINENFSIDTVVGQKYQFEADIKLFGKANQAVLIFNAPVKGNLDSQIIMKMDGSYEIKEYGATKIISTSDITYVDGVFGINIVFNGFDDKLKFLVNMLSSDADAANIAKDTGVLLDNVHMSRLDELSLDGEYKTVNSTNFDKLETGISGDAVFQATGFAGSDRIIAADGINGTKCLKTVYRFFEDGGWQNGQLYLDVNKTGATVENRIYKFSGKLKPFGSVDKVVVGFEYKGGTREYVDLNADGTAVLERAASGTRLLTANLTVTDGVYSYNIYLYGNGGYVFNFFNLHSSSPAVANEQNDSGFLLDDYLFAEKKEAEKPGLNVESTLYNKADDKDLSIAASIKDIVSVSLDGTALAEGVTYADGRISIAKAAFGGIKTGAHTFAFTDSDGNVYNLEVNVRDAACGSVYENDFSAMPDLNGDQDAKDAFFFNSMMDPAAQNIYTVGEGAARAVKFVSTEAVSDAYIGLFQTNPQQGKINMLTKNRLNGVTLTLKPENAALLRARALVFDGKTSVELFTIDLDVVAGKRVDGVKGNDSLAFSVTAKADGWYEVFYTFTFGGDHAENACAYVVFATCKEQENSAWYMDSIDVTSELIPALSKVNGIYDAASSAAPYYIVELYKTFNISSIKIGDKALVENTDYTISVTPVGGTRIDLSAELFKSVAVGTKGTVSILTSKGNTLEAPYEVVDSTPALPAEKTPYDKALKGEAGISIDLKGYAVDSVTVGGVKLNGTEYYLDNTDTKLLFKYDYLKNLAAGDVTFTLKTTSGATGEFVITVSDSTPVFGNLPAYQKSVGGDYVVDLDIFGKTIVSVTLGKTALAATDYSYADGKLTVAAKIMQALAAGEYTLSVKTVAEISATFNVKDVDPEISGSYTAKKGENLVITVNLHSKAIVSVTVEGLTLSASEYSYADGKLTVFKEIFDEIAAGERKLVLVTEGGKAELTFTLSEGSTSSRPDSSVEGESCKTSIGADGVLALALLAVAALFVRRRNK